MSAVWKRRIGIVGGLGPFAHIELEQRLLEATARRLGRPPLDQEFPPWVVSSLPQTPDRTRALLEQGESPVPGILRSLHVLRTADFALIACNTAHCFLPQLREASPLPILDLVGETISHIVRTFGAGATVGLLATSGTLASGIYAQAARRAGDLRLLSALDVGDSGTSGRELQERSVMGAIYGRGEGEDDLGGGIKSGAHWNPELLARIHSELAGIIGRFRDRGAGAILLGCTELSLVLGRKEIEGVAVIDPLQVAAAAAVEIAAGDRPLPDGDVF